MNEQEKFADGESKFNKSLDDLRRISELQDTANKVSVNIDWSSMMIWRNILERLDGEILPTLKKEEADRLKSFRVPLLPDPSSYRVLGRNPPAHIRRKLGAWHNELNRFIVAKGLGLQVKEKRSSFILPDG